jgi:nucleotide-binding universal stress UspA family protein
MPWQGYDMDQWRDEFAAEAEVVLRRAFESAMGGVPIDVSVELVAVEGAPARELIAYADRDDDVLVVGAPMRRWRTSMSLAGQCLRRAACPVVAVPAPALARTRRPRALARDVQREVVRHIQAGVDGGGH